MARMCWLSKPRVSSLLFLLLMWLLASCKFPPPARTAAYEFNKDAAIKLAFEAIRHTEHYADDAGYNAAQAVPVTFANGTAGAFVTFEVSGPARGYQVLLQTQGGFFTILEQRNTLPNGWGRRLTAWNDRASTPIELMNLKLEANQPARALLRVNGYGHAGTGMVDNGVFEIIDVQEKRIRVLFRGAETSNSFNAEGWVETYTHVLLNSENQPVKIQVYATKCTYAWLDDKNVWLIPKLMG
jgi:hypothetical protein